MSPQKCVVTSVFSYAKGITNDIIVKLPTIKYVATNTVYICMICDTILFVIQHISI